MNFLFSKNLPCRKNIFNWESPTFRLLDRPNQQKGKKMSESIPIGEIPQEETIKSVEAPPKSFLIMTDEITMAMLGKLFPSLRFLQVEGLPIKDNTSHMLLANPIIAVTPEETENK